MAMFNNQAAIDKIYQRFIKVHQAKPKLSERRFDRKNAKATINNLNIKTLPHGSEIDIPADYVEVYQVYANADNAQLYAAVTEMELHKLLSVIGKGINKIAQYSDANEGLEKTKIKLEGHLRDLDEVMHRYLAATKVSDNYYLKRYKYYEAVLNKKKPEDLDIILPEMKLASENILQNVIAQRDEYQKQLTKL